MFGFPPAGAKAPGRQNRKCKHRSHRAVRKELRKHAPMLGQSSRKNSPCRLPTGGVGRRKPPPSRPEGQMPYADFERTFNWRRHSCISTLQLLEYQVLHLLPGVRAAFADTCIVYTCPRSRACPRSPAACARRSPTRVLSRASPHAAEARAARPMPRATRWTIPTPLNARAADYSHLTLGLPVRPPRPRSQLASSQLLQRGNVGTGPPAGGPADQLHVHVENASSWSDLGENDCIA